jgi:rhodanese-related sulfurtransferase
MPREIDVESLAAKLKAGEPMMLLDVRQSWEHETAALPASLLIPLNELTRRVGEVKPADGTMVVVYCHHGVRSLSGAAVLERAGIGNVVSLAGGIDAWSLRIDPSVPRY